MLLIQQLSYTVKMFKPNQFLTRSVVPFRQVFGLHRFQCICVRIIVITMLFLLWLDGPGNISIKPNDEQRTVTEGNTLGPLCCDAACNPTCLVKWRSSITKKGRVDSFSSNLHISNITRGQSGVYTCEASNSLGNKSKDIKVVVNCEYYSLITHAICEKKQYYWYLFMIL